MKKWTKIIAMMLMLALTLTLVSGCGKSSQEGEELEIYELNVGLPLNAESPNWANLQQAIKDAEEFDSIKVNYLEVPAVGTEEYADFLKKVRSGKIDIFFSSSNEQLDELIGDDIIADYSTINSANPAIFESLLSVHKDVSRENNRQNYSIPVNASVQGLFLNKDVFEQAKVALPTDWASLNAAIPALKAAGVTPFAAGFADGAGLWLDEMVLVEGGTAEHSAVPSKGVIASWTRAIGNIKNFYNAGAFSADALINTHDVAVAEFVNKQAAMIVCNSKDLVGSADGENTVFMSFPKSSTGIKEDNAVILKTELAVYCNADRFNKKMDDTTNVNGIISTFIEYYVSNSDYYAGIYGAECQYPFNKELGSELESEMDNSVYNLLSKTEAADMSMENYILTFDQMESGLISVLDGSSTVADYLTSVTEAEIKAQAELKLQRLEDKK